MDARTVRVGERELQSRPDPDRDRLQDRDTSDRRDRRGRVAGPHLGARADGDSAVAARGRRRRGRARVRAGVLALRLGGDDRRRAGPDRPRLRRGGLGDAGGGARARRGSRSPPPSSSSARRGRRRDRGHGRRRATARRRTSYGSSRSCSRPAACRTSKGSTLEKLGLETTRTGIVVDERLRTSVAGIWAAGDVNAVAQLTPDRPVPGAHRGRGHVRHRRRAGRRLLVPPDVDLHRPGAGRRRPHRGAGPAKQGTTSASRETTTSSASRTSRRSTASSRSSSTAKPAACSGCTSSRGTEATSSRGWRSRSSSARRSTTSPGCTTCTRPTEKA